MLSLRSLTASAATTRAMPLKTISSRFGVLRRGMMATSAQPSHSTGAGTVTDGRHNEKRHLPSKADNPDYLTRNGGQPAPNNRDSLTVGRNGPMLLEDTDLLDKLGQFNREKVPERVVHARGTVFKGHFETTEDITDLSCAHMFGQIGRKTPTAVRFSTVTHERGSPESLRDVRGFATKFYTQEGNWDLVGNNIPVFFIRDSMAFPDLVHALRPNPKSNIQEGWRILDFLSFHPESIHMLTWLLDEPGIPQDWRHQEGWGVNTFSLRSKEGKDTLVKFHWAPTLGAKFMTDEQAQAAGEKNMRHSHATHDMYNAIAKGDYPSWEFKIQTMDPELRFKGDLDFDPCDATKVWPEDQFPFRTVGRMVLDQTVENFHNESEQIAFSPGAMVPGITYSDDRMLQQRLHTYQDTQRYRIGVNYDQLPINQPKCPFHLNSEQGAMNFSHNTGEVNYFPSHKQGDDGHTPQESPVPAETIRPIGSHVSGDRVRDDINSDGRYDDFKQAGDRWRDMSVIRKGLFLKNLVPWLADPKLPKAAADKWIDYFGRADAGLGAELNAGMKAMAGGAKVMDWIANRPAEKGTTVA